MHQRPHTVERDEVLAYVKLAGRVRSALSLAAEAQAAAAAGGSYAAWTLPSSPTDGFGRSGGLSEDENRRLESIKVGLDQCWDLLRERRALREAGGDPETAHVRDPEVVEHYEQ